MEVLAIKGPKHSLIALAQADRLFEVARHHPPMSEHPRQTAEGVRNAEPHLALARIYGLERQPSLAQQHAELGSRRDPGQGYEILAELMMDAGRFDDAAANARRSLQADASRYMSRFLLGVIAQQRGRCDEAIGHYRRAAELGRPRGRCVGRRGLCAECRRRATHRRRPRTQDPLRDRAIRVTRKRAVQIHAVIRRISAAGAKRGDVQHGHDDDPADDVLGADVAQQVLERDRSFVLVPVRRADRQQAASRLGLRPDQVGATTINEPDPVEQLNIPAKMTAASLDSLPGAIAAPAGPPTLSQGSGSGGGAGTGTGSGIGPGTGSGLGPGSGGGTGGGAYRPGNGVTLPVVVREVKPAYTADAMRAKVQGSVWLECIVMPDGSVGEVKVTRSLDPIFGLDQEAIKAAKMWRFKPGMRQGEPVPVIITIELTFTLR